MHSPNLSTFAFFPPFAYIESVPVKKIVKKVKLLLLQTSSKTVAFFFI